MKLNIKTSVLPICFVILLSYLPSNRVNAQNVAEPPIPVYIICPYHEDSLRMAYENSLSTNGSTLVFAAKKYDTLQSQVQKSSAENTAHFTWLYALVALLGTMNIVLLFSVSRIRKELAQMKRFEHHQKLAASDLPVDLERSSQIQEALFNQEPAPNHKPKRIRKTQTKKPHS
jgi:hypothetical protein